MRSKEINTKATVSYIHIQYYAYTPKMREVLLQKGIFYIYIFMNETFSLLYK